MSTDAMPAAPCYSWPPILIALQEQLAFYPMACTPYRPSKAIHIAGEHACTSITALIPSTLTLHSRALCMIGVRLSGSTFAGVTHTRRSCASPACSSDFMGANVCLLDTKGFRRNFLHQRYEERPRSHANSCCTQHKFSKGVVMRQSRREWYMPRMEGLDTHSATLDRLSRKLHACLHTPCPFEGCSSAPIQSMTL
jgi:hypothetical protein